MKKHLGLKVTLSNEQTYALPQDLDHDSIEILEGEGVEVVSFTTNYGKAIIPSDKVALWSLMDIAMETRDDQTEQDITETISYL